MLLVWISFNEHDLLANYSWNPNSGASFAAMVAFGPRMLPFIFTAPLLGDCIVPQLSLPAVRSGIEGVGLGVLATHGGRIWLDADTPGAAIHFTLPVAPVRSPQVVLP